MLRPRLTDCHGIHVSQDKLDFLIPYLGEDVPLCVDPFLLWKSPSQHYQSLHSLVVTSFNSIGYQYADGNKEEMIKILMELSECNEIGLGFSATGKGKRMSQELSIRILDLFRVIPNVRTNGFNHFEIIQLLVDGISKDRISDITSCIIKSFLIDYTIQQSNQAGIPVDSEKDIQVFDTQNCTFKTERIGLPINPESGEQILFVPKYWLRRGPWISSGEYANGFLPQKILKENIEEPRKGELLTYNRDNYGIIEEYIKVKERSSETCKNDPIFTPLPLLSLKRKIKRLESLPTGNENGNDKKFEEIAYHILSTTFYPHLDFALSQARTDSGVLIRDLIFYNNRTIDFLGDILKDYNSKQLVFEVKNVREIEREHIFQLNRYLNDNFGKFGIIVTRNKISRKIIRNSIDLWSGQRRCIIFVTDADLALMVDLFENKQRMPIEILKRQYVEFTRLCPS